jgi:pantoate--beta-alanine ligase
LDVLERLADLRAARVGWRNVGLVPTMGYLHEGHLSLLRAARRQNDVVVMSLFVNPAQFGPQEDFRTYPRDTARDLQLAESAGADLVFMPSVESVYPDGFDTWVEVGALTREWEGEKRPGHFRGVATVVLKLLQMVQPDRAYFGEKDYQQLLVVRKMVADLNVPVEIVACPTVREPSGLALSSRNAYFSAERRVQAGIIRRALGAAERLAAEGEVSAAVLKQAAESVLADESGARLDYLGIVDPETLEPVERLDGAARLIAAVFFDGVRLIDNLSLQARSGRAARYHAD